MPTPLTIHEAKQVAHAEGRTVFLSRAFPTDACPYKAKNDLQLLAPGTKEILANGRVKSIRPMSVSERKADTNLANRLAREEGFTNAHGWWVHWGQLYGFGDTDRKVFRLQLEIQSAVKKVNPIDMVG